MKAKKFLSLTLCCVMFLSGCVGADEKVNEEHTSSFFAMDTYMSFSAYGENADTALEKAQNEITRFENLLSVTDKESDIYSINHSNGENVEVSEDTAELISFALDMAEKTGGALEPTIYPVLTAWGFTTDENRIPSKDEITELLKSVGYDKVEINKNSVNLPSNMMLDLGAVGKGYAGDAAINLLREEGITSALISLGGNIQAIGVKPDGSKWHLGLRDPFLEGTLGTLEVSDLAVVTSGNYEKYFVGDDGNTYGHIIDPATGCPVENGLESVTVIAKEGKLCDALSTSLFVMGLDKASDYWKAHKDFEMILITENGEIYLTEGIENSFTLDNTHSNMKINVVTK